MLCRKIPGNLFKGYKMDTQIPLTQFVREGGTIVDLLEANNVKCRDKQMNECSSQSKLLELG